MSKLTNKKIIKNQVKNLFISILVAAVFSLVIKQIPKQTAYQFQGEITFVTSLDIFTRYLSSTDNELLMKDVSSSDFVGLTLDTDEAINNCAFHKINGEYTMTAEDLDNRIIFSILVDPEINQRNCISSLQKVLNKEAKKVLVTHRNILVKTNEIYDDFNKKKEKEEEKKNSFLQKNEQLIPLLSIEKLYGRVDYSVNERVLNTLKIELLNDTINRGDLFAVRKVSLRSKKQSSAKEVFFIVMIAIFSIMNLKLFIRLIRKF
jgi:hypothetical protein